jgi:hypothetical protein
MVYVRCCGSRPGRHQQRLPDASVRPAVSGCPFGQCVGAISVADLSELTRNGIHSSHIRSTYLLECSDTYLAMSASSGVWVGGNGLLQEPVEEHAARGGGSPVEPDGILVEAVGQVSPG